MNRRALHYYEFGPFRLNLTDRLLLRSDELVPLTPKVFDTLLVLVENAGHVVEKSELMQQLWPDSFVEESSLTQNISLLRRALSEVGNDTNYIETIPKRGYRFVAEVHEVAESPELLPQVVSPDNQQLYSLDVHTREDLATNSAWTLSHAQNAQSRPRKANTYLAAFSGCVALGLLFTLVYWFRHDKGKSDDAMPRSVAVLPFKTIGTQTESERLGLGMADALIIKLSRVDQLTVLPTSSVFKFSERDKDVVAIGKDLGVEGVLDGTVQRDGDWVRVTAQLIRLSDGKTVWSGKFDERYRSLFTLQDSISEQLSLSLRPQMAGNNRKAAPARLTDNTEAYQAYLTGIYFWNRRTKENLPKAVAYLEQAVEKDPNFAQAQAILADCYYLGITDEYANGSPEESIRRSNEAVKKALALDDNLAEAHTVKAGLLQVYRNFDEAGREFQRALELNPNYAVAHVRYSYFLYMELRQEEALSHMRRAQQLDPISAVTNGALAGMLYTARDYDSALAYAKKALEIEPAAFGARLNMGEAYIQKHMFTEAHQAFDVARQYNPRYACWEKAYAYALAGRREDAMRMIAEVQKLNTEKLPYYFNYALVYGAMGETDKAFEAMEKINLNRFLIASIKYDPQFDPLRADPRFKEFLKRHKLDF